MGGGVVEMILIVEDDKSVRETLADTLSDEGYTVAAVENGQQALDYLSHHPPPCLILLDLWMPVMSGVEFRQAQVADPAIASIPVIVISAATDMRARLQSMPAQAYLPKPVDLGALIGAVAQHC